jgi:hypothetical protein
VTPKGGKIPSRVVRCIRPALFQVWVIGDPKLDPCEADVQGLHVGVVPLPMPRAHYFFGHPFRKLYTASGLNHSWALHRFVPGQRLASFPWGASRRSQA